MKNSITLLLACCFLFLTNAQAQLSAPSWSGKFEPSKAFVENKGQFEQRLKNPDSKILYAADQGSVQIYFSQKGLTYKFDRKEKNKNRRDGDETQPRIFFETDMVNMVWEGANANAELVAEGVNPDFYTYEMKKNEKEYYDIQRIRGYQKLIYKNLYPNIDVEYVFHPQGGIKYALILHPGADVSQVKMKYADNEKLLFTNDGEIFIDTKFGDMVDHAPVTFYADNKAAISSRFVRNGNTVSFELGNYDNSKTVVVDPWTQTPVFANSNGVWEVDVDGTGNVYVIGGDMPMQLRKYNSTGTVQWTYNTTYDTANYWLGTMATDLNGNTYVTSGSTANIRKVSTAGALTWNAGGGAFDEYWCIAFNCDQTKLIVGGTSTGLFPPSTANGMIFDINTNNGNVITSQAVGTNRPGFIINDISEVRSITSSKNARYYYLTLDTIGAIDDNLSACPSGNDVIFGKNHGYAFGYKSENYRPNNGNSGIKAIKANANFVYTHNGTTVHKRSLIDGSILATASIPGGGSTATLGFNQPHNNGLDIDANGNVYVGSANGVYKYDANLTQLSSAATSFAVYDVAVNNNGEVVVCGATGDQNSTSRTGYVQSFSMSAAAPITLECCDANICAAGPFCSDDPTVTLTPSGTSGTWSGPGISGNGVFNPSVAGAGTHTITNTLGCGSGAINITVLTCVALDICLEANGTLTANTGVGPFTWEDTQQIQDCSACLFGCNFPPNCATTTSGFAAFGGTGATTSAAPAAYPVRVTDAHGNTLTINSSGSLSNCSQTCTLTLSTANTPATCGNANGGASVSVTAGTGPYTYSWSPGGATTSSISNVGGGNYTVTVTSQGGACTETATVTVAESGGITLSTNSTQATCGNANGGASVSITAGTGPFTYLWSPGGATTSSISNVAAGDYTVTVNGANNCSSTATVTVSSSNAIVLSNSVTNTSCGNANGTAATNITIGTGPFTYAWSPGGATTASISNLAAGDYTVTVTGAGGCTATGTVSVGASTALSVTPSATAASCNQSNGSAAVSVTGGSGTYTYLWSNQATTSSISGVATGNYDVTINDGQGCTETETILVPQNTSLTGTATTTEVSCGQANSGAIDLTVSGGTPGFTYSWSPGGASTQDLSGIAAGDYTVTVTDAGGCQFISTYTVDSENSMVVASNVEHETCKGYHDGSIDLTVTGSNGPFTYLWTPGNASTQDLSGLQGGNYSVVVTDQGTGCSDTQTFNVQDGYNYPISITQDGDTLTATSAPNYTWYLNGVEIPGANTQSIVITEGGNYHVTVGSQNCEFESNHIETSCICSNSIEDNSLFHGISVYPNPANEELNVVISLTSVEQASVTLIDLTGRRLWLKKENDKADNFAWKIPVADIAAGNYFVQINVGGQTKSVKVLVKD
ncbi:MAG: T9SS type A sorting domain-containing protein [Bacteroidia bacterium]